MVGTYAWGSNLRWDQGGEGSSEDGRHAYVMNARLVWGVPVVACGCACE